MARGLVPLVALAAVLAGCTGTTENIPPLLLAIGQVDTTPTPEQPQMVLVEDNFSSNQTTPRALTVVPGSARNIDYPAVASDVVDRAGTRSAMVVLTRQLSASANPAPASQLVTFDLSGIDPTAPTAFAQTSSIQLTGGTSPLFSGTGAPWCFSGVTVSRTGRYVTLLDDPSACGDTSGRPARLFQVDTQTSSVTPVVTSTGIQNTQATVPFDDQAQTDESVYFLVPGVNQALVYKDPVPHTTVNAPAGSIGQLPGQEQTALRGNGTDLVAVTNPNRYAFNSLSSSLQSLDLTNPSATTNVDTVQGARALAVDPAGITQQVVVAGASRLAVHATPGDGTPAETAVGLPYTGVAATIDPINRFAYVVDDGRIVVIDLYSAAPDATGWYRTFSPDISLPVSAATNQNVTTVAWVRAAP